MASPPPSPAGRRIGFVSTRFGGTDGVSLEARKWATVLERVGHSCSYFAGGFESPHERFRLVPEAHFAHPEIQAIYAAAFSQRLRPPGITRLIHQLKDLLKEQIRQFIREFEVELIIAENALSIPLNLPLGLALTEAIAETGIPTIAHHHDLFWERPRFLVNCVWDYLNMSFPPHLPFIQHVVINSSAANQLSVRTGVSTLIVPNVMDFDHPPAPPDDYARNIRADLGVAPDELFILQPTRVVARKGIEHAIELVNLLGLKARLVISHAAGDEGLGYQKRVRDFADLLHVATNFESELIRPQRGLTADGRKIYVLADAYPQADLVTYPSSIEGFGNAFLESIYYRRPIVVNNYTIFAIDIKPKGFRVIEFDGFVDENTVAAVRRVLGDPGLAAEMAERNYVLARRHFSYTMLERHLQMLLAECFGEQTDN